MACNLVPALTCIGCALLLPQQRIYDAQGGVGLAYAKVYCGCCNTHPRSSFRRAITGSADVGVPDLYVLEVLAAPSCTAVDMAARVALSACSRRPVPFTGAKSQHRKHCRLTVAATQAADGGSGTGGSGGSSSEVADQRQQQEVQPPRRRELLLSSVQLAVLGAMPGSEDGRTILNSVLGASCGALALVAASSAHLSSPSLTFKPHPNRCLWTASAQSHARLPCV